MTRENGHPGEVGSSPRAEPSLGELFTDLTREMTALIRQEATLASTELSRKVTLAGRSVGMLALGGFVVYAGFLAMMAAGIIILAHFIEWWVAALIVGLIVAGGGYLLVRRSLDALRHLDLAPRQTVATLKEDLAWAKDQTT